MHIGMPGIGWFLISKDAAINLDREIPNRGMLSKVHSFVFLRSRTRIETTIKLLDWIHPFPGGHLITASRAKTSGEGKPNHNLKR
jgi:hypothetical protein